MATHPKNVAVLQELGLSADLYAGYNLALDLITAGGFCTIGATLFLKRSNNWMAVLASMALVLMGFITSLESLAEAFPIWSPPVAIAGFLGNSIFYAMFFLFPDGRFVPRWTIVPAAIWVAYQALYYFLPEWPPSGYEWVDVWMTPGLLATILFAQIYRYRRVSGPIERQQTKWVVYGLTVASLAIGASFFPRLLFPSLAEPGIAGILYVLLGYTVNVLGFLLIPLSIALAILRYRLWNIDVIINRTLVYAALTTSVVVIYALFVGSLGALLHDRGNFLISLLAAGLVAVLFAPLRQRLQRWVNRLMYGERDDPYGVLSRLGRRLEAALEPSTVLSTIVDTIVGALKLPYAAIAMKRADGFEVAAVHGSPTGEEINLPLNYAGDTVGCLMLAPRAPGETFSPADKRLLEDLARQAEVAVHAVRLTADLQRSRERLVSAREEERRRLRRDLHDGLGPTLATLSLGLDVSLKLLKRDPQEAEPLLKELKTQTQDAVVDIRRLVYGLRPPALDDLGLVSAIREQASKHGTLADDSFGEPGRAAGKNGLVFSVEAPEKLPPLPAAVEVACYRIAQEAITNVVRHARARSCRVRFSIDENENELELEVADDGEGLPADRRAGVGMSSMAERAAELGGTCTVATAPEGGTRVLARLPLFAEEEE